MTEEPTPPFAAPKRPWAGRLLWTVVPLLLGVMLTLMAIPRRSPMYFSFSDGGILAKIVAAISLLALIYGAIVGRRRLNPLWLVAAPVLVLWLGVAGVALQAAGMRDFVTFDVDPQLHEIVFREGLGELLHISGIATLFGALLLVQAAGFLSMQARPDTTQVRWNKTLAVVGWFVGLVMMLIAAGLTCDRFEDGFPIALITSFAFAAALIDTRNLRRTEPAGPETERAWSTGLAAGVCATAAVAASILGGLLHARAAFYYLMTSESVDPEARLTRIPTIYETAKESVWNVGLVGLAAVVLVLLVGLGARVDGARSKSLSSVGLIVVLLLAPFGAMTFQAHVLSSEAHEYRQGKPGELVEDRRVEPKTLEVQLAPIAEWGDVIAGAEVVLAGKKSPWTPTTPALFEGVSSDEPIQIGVLGDYIAAPVERQFMPRRNGARIRVGVLSVLPEPFLNDQEEVSFGPEKILHIDATDPERLVLRWASRRIVHTEDVVPRSALANAVRDQWRMYGSHANENDRKRDTAIIHFASSASLHELVAIGDAVATQRRSVRVAGSYEMLPAVRPWFARARPSLQELDDALNVEAQGTNVSAGLGRWAERALQQCSGRPCVSPSGADTWGLELGDRCGTYLCSAETVAKLWRAIGMARAVTGDEAGAEQALTRARLFAPGLPLPTTAPTAAANAYRRVSRTNVPRVVLGAISLNGRLEPNAVRAALLRREGLVRACYADGLGASPAIGRVVVRMVIGRDGLAAEAGNGGSDLPSAEVVSCVVRSFRGMQFPKPDAGVVTVVSPWMIAAP